MFIIPTFPLLPIPVPFGLLVRATFPLPIIRRQHPYPLPSPTPKIWGGGKGNFPLPKGRGEGRQHPYPFGGKGVGVLPSGVKATGRGGVATFPTPNMRQHPLPSPPLWQLSPYPPPPFIMGFLEGGKGNFPLPKGRGEG